MGIPCATPAESDAKFAKRSRVFRIAFFAWVVLWLIRAGLVAIELPMVATVCSYLLLFGALALPLLYVWSANCTYCGGGIKLDGRTCQRCGHIFDAGQ